MGVVTLALGAPTLARPGATVLVGGVLFGIYSLVCFRGAAQSILLPALWIGFGRLIHGSMTTAGAISAEDLPTRGRQAALGVLEIAHGLQVRTHLVN